MWVPISNLMGPRGKDGRDGEKGDPGPVNVGLDPNVPITWDQQGGITFNLVDGSAQTVNLPIASAQSAGLLGAGGQLPSTGARDITELLIASLVPIVQPGKVQLMRSGNLVSVTTDAVLASAGNSSALTLPEGFRPALSRLDFTVWLSSGSGDAWGSLSNVSFFESGSVWFNRPAGDRRYRGAFVFPTDDEWPVALPGTAV